MAAKNHYHIYERVLSDKGRFRCIDPDCTHHESKERIVGKNAVCSQCGKIFVLSKGSLNLRCPICGECHVLGSKPKMPLVTVSDLRLPKISPPASQPVMELRESTDPRKKLSAEERDKARAVKSLMK